MSVRRTALWLDLPRGRLRGGGAHPRPRPPAPAPGSRAPGRVCATRGAVCAWRGAVAPGSGPMSTEQASDEFGRALDVVCAQYGTTTAALVGRGRSRHVSAARQALYAVLAARGWGDVAIARSMGREHSTVHHGRRRAVREQPEAIAAALEALEPEDYCRHMLALRVPQLA